MKIPRVHRYRYRPSTSPSQPKPLLRVWDDVTNTAQFVVDAWHIGENTSCTVAGCLICGEHRVKSRVVTTPVDWDLESCCTVGDCLAPATHRELVGMLDEVPKYRLVCCEHARGGET